ncbi:MAG: exodeoxyribonuclease VII large subunit [Pseudomonadota bacterium]|nr:exodeoxyribonuclease VII large subunit [Pseudomonadota bacterium]
MERFTVSELTGEIAALLGGSFDDIEVEGEVSGFKAHGSGHWYFCLKDGDAVLNAAMFRNANARVRRPPRDGDRIIARGSIDVYPPRGSYSLVVRAMQASGDGDLLRRLEELRARLAAEGLFDAARKRPLPPVPRAIGIATSPSGAALHDIVRVVRQRFPAMPIYVAPCRVQGEGAGLDVARAIGLLNRHGRSDVLIVGRGGGSAEDLWCFNEEAVVRAIVASRIPVVSAVGHEVDVSLADLAADVRAATPSHAAELVTPVRDELLAFVDAMSERLRHAMQRRVAQQRDRVSRVRLLHPRQRVERGRMRLDELDERLREAALRGLVLRRGRLASATRHLEVLSPLAVLVRGYAIVTKDDIAVTDAAALAPGDHLDVRLARGGSVEAEVLRVRPVAPE